MITQCSISTVIIYRKTSSALFYSPVTDFKAEIFDDAVLIDEGTATPRAERASTATFTLLIVSTVLFTFWFDDTADAVRLFNNVAPSDAVVAVSLAKEPS
jgi:hypothetical protein